MGLTPGRISTSSNITSNSVSNSIQPLYGVVYEVIMDTGSDTAKSKGLILLHLLVVLDLDYYRIIRQI